jgi:hypothetical protein
MEDFMEFIGLLIIIVLVLFLSPKISKYATEITDKISSRFSNLILFVIYAVIGFITTFIALTYISIYFIPYDYPTYSRHTVMWMQVKDILFRVNNYVTLFSYASLIVGLLIGGLSKYETARYLINMVAIIFYFVMFLILLPVIFSIMM